MDWIASYSTLRRSKIRRFSSGCVVIATALLAAVTTLGFMGGVYWQWDLAAHFRVQYTLAALCLLLFLAVLRRYPWMLVAALLLLINAATIAPLYLSGISTAVPESAVSGPNQSIFWPRVPRNPRETRGFSRGPARAGIPEDWLVGTGGLEPPTYGTKNRCSTN